MLKFLKANKGFTLIELILIAAIIGVMTSAVLAVLNPVEQMKKGNDARRKSDLSQIQKAIESYYQDNSRYPVAGGAGSSLISGIAWGSKWAVGNTVYMNILPKDPNASYKYFYKVSADGQTYGVYARLERLKDPQACNQTGAACNGTSFSPGGNSACGPGPNGSCNYGVTSPDIKP